MTALLALNLFTIGAVQKMTVTGVVGLNDGRVAKQAAVWLEGTDKSKPLARAVIDQKDRMFIPHVMVVPVGTRVDFPNNDTVLHNVFAEYNASKFNLGSYPRGSSRKATFENKGLVVLQCNMHSEMGAFIVVVDTPYYTVADEKGNFRIENVPPGRYKVHAWHESNQFFEQDITLGANSKALNIELARRKR